MFINYATHDGNFLKINATKDDSRKFKLQNVYSQQDLQTIPKEGKHSTYFNKKYLSNKSNKQKRFCLSNTLIAVNRNGSEILTIISTVIPRLTSDPANEFFG